ncbi:MAG: DUF367 family protein [Fervidicoccaceae archaeon]
MSVECNEIELFVLRFSEDSPSASTGVKLYRLGLARRIGLERASKIRGIFLDPFSSIPISREDLSYARSIIVVDRSWNVLERERRMPLRTGKGTRRRLPFLIASNPINYAKAYKLSSVEALAAALFILGCEERAKELMSKFKWGQNFFSLNGRLLERYRNSLNLHDLLRAEEEETEKFLGGDMRGEGSS